MDRNTNITIFTTCLRAAFSCVEMILIRRQEVLGLSTFLERRLEIAHFHLEKAALLLITDNLL